MGPPMWPWHYGLIARPVSEVEWSGVECMPCAEVLLLVVWSLVGLWVGLFCGFKVFTLWWVGFGLKKLNQWTTLWDHKVLAATWQR